MIVGTVWRPIGPSPMAPAGRQDNGLTSAIAVSPNDPDVIFIGTAGGGVWRTSDGGTNWRPVFDQQISLGIGNPSAITIDPNDTNTIYVGTSPRLTPQAAAGIFKSTDGGASWVQLGSGFPDGNTGNATQFFGQIINVIVVDPANSQTVYLASNNGVFRSQDGGLNWGARGVNSNGDVRSLVLDATSPVANRILYGGITNQGIFQSTDGGQNWAQIMGAATPVVAGALAGGNIRKSVVALAPPTSPAAAGGIQVLYANFSGGGGAPDPVGIFVSTDQGANWALQASAGMPGNTQGGYSFHMAVDPASPGDGANDTIYLGAVGHGRSTDSGANFTALNGLHADNHSWAFAPQPGGGSTVFCGNDGGIFRSTDGGNTWNSLNSGGLQTGLFYNMSVKPDATASVTLGAMQDNGVQTTSGAAGLSWSSPQGGDGWSVAYDGVTANQAYATSGFWPGQDNNGNIQACTRVFVSAADGTDLPPTVPGVGQAFPDVTPWFGGPTDQGCYLANIETDPSNAGVVYVGGNQNLWQSRDGGNNWTSIGAFPSNPITALVSVAPSNGNNVVVTNGAQVSVSTNALGPAANITFTNITRNLPGRNVLRAAFDPNDPTVIYAVLGGFNGVGAAQQGHVFRTTIGGTSWQDISPDLDVPFGGLALDGGDTPTTIYVGTDFGVLRSVDLGASWTVLDDIHFPKAPVTDLEIGRGSGILRAATYGRGIFEFAEPDGPAITVNLQDGFEFGTVCDGPEFLTLQVFNVGGDDLMIHSVQRLNGSTAFEVDPFPSTPFFIAAGEEVDFTIRFTPTTPGVAEAAVIRVASNDPGAPYVDLLATGTGGVAVAELAIADAGDFGDVCMGDFVDRDLVINNSGDCPLRITAITSNSAAFLVPNVASFPLQVAAGSTLAVPLRFQPSAVGAANATVRVFSNDPNSPDQLEVNGNTPTPRLVLSIADSGDFGKVCVGNFRDLPLTVSNSGGCELTITGIASSGPEFEVPNVAILPIVIAPGASTELNLRFRPTSFGAKAATFSITSDDPASPATLDVTGVAPSGKIVLTGTTHFGAVELGVRAVQRLSICNTGDCDLHVSKVGFKPQGPCAQYQHRPDGCYPDCSCGCDQDDKYENHHDCDQKCLNFKIISNPFPERVHSGSCLDILIQYVPTCDNAACCELEIESDDPENLSQTLLVTGHLRRTLHSALKCWIAQELQEALIAGRGC